MFHPLSAETQYMQRQNARIQNTKYIIKEQKCCAEDFIVTEQD